MPASQPIRAMAARLVAGTALAVALVVLPAGRGVAQPVDLPLPVAAGDRLPAGVKIADSTAGPVYVDAGGHVLYGMDMRTVLRSGVNPAMYCQDACTRDWQPMLAPAGSLPNVAYPIGNHDRGGSENPGHVAPAPARAAIFYDDPQKAPDWTIIAGPQGPQWVYKGWHLVYTRRGDGPGSIAYDGADNFTWNTLKFVPPAPKIKAPAGVRPQLLDRTYVLADAHGRLLFSGQCGKDCAKWQPMQGGMAVGPVGEWKVRLVGDKPQWLYRGKPVFVNSEDDPTAIPAGAALLRP